MSEKAIQNDILLAASGRGLTLWRQNVGQGWAGDAQHLKDGSVLIRNPRPLHAGLCKGSADLIGLRALEITAEMVGDTIAQFVAIEVKSPSGRVSQAQQTFLNFVARVGGIAVVARSPEDLP